MFKKTALTLALSTLFVGVNAQAATIFEKDNGDYMKLYGEVGVGGHIGADYEYDDYYTEDKTYIDDTFATIGVKGQADVVYYRLELDFERENWAYGSGDMVLAIDKAFMGYKITDKHAIEFGLTDTALDDYDKYGDYTFDTTVETGEAGDQANTIKYEGSFSDFRAGVSYSYDAESSSGSKLGDVFNGYIGYFSKKADVVVGAETRTGAEGDSKYGEQFLFALGARFYVTDSIEIGLNGYLEKEDISQDDDNTGETDDDDEPIKVYNDYQTLDNKGALISARYKFTPKIQFTASANYEAYEAWDIESAYGVSPDNEYSWGKDRTWTTLGVNYKPTNAIVFAVEVSMGQAAQDAYAYSRIYF